MLPDTARRRLHYVRGLSHRNFDPETFCHCPFCLQQFSLLTKAEHSILSLHAQHSNKEVLATLFLAQVKELHEASGVSLWVLKNGAPHLRYSLDWPEELTPINSTPISFFDPNFTVLQAPLPHSGLGEFAIVASALPNKRKLYSKQRLLNSLARHAGLALAHSHADSYYIKRTASLQLLKEIAHQFASKVHLNDLFISIYAAVRKVITADVFFVALYTESTQEVEIAYVFEAGQQLEPIKFFLNEGPTSQVIKSNAPLKIVRDSALIPGALHLGNTDKNTQSLMFAPISLHDSILGVLSVQSYSPESYTDEDLLLLSAIANQAAIAIQNAQLYEHILKLATTDSLTGLTNKRAFTEALALRLERASAENRKMALIMIDSDSLKQINDTYGHSAGDDHLVSVATMLRAYVREEDLICRYGGDEFMILLADTDMQAAAVVAERIVEKVFLSFQVIGNVPVRATISAGVAEFPGNATNDNALIRAADNNLRAAKRAGKNRVNTIGCD